MKKGRPMLNDTPRNKTISIKVTVSELERVQRVCIERNIRYIDVIMRGVESLDKPDKQ